MTEEVPHMMDSRRSEKCWLVVKTFRLYENEEAQCWKGIVKHRMQDLKQSEWKLGHRLRK